MNIRLFLIWTLAWTFNQTITVFGDSQRYFPSTIRPLKYNITLNPTLNETWPMLYGNVTITVFILRTTNNVTLHARQLKFSKQDIILKDSVNKIITVLRIRTNMYNETCNLMLQNNLIKDKVYTIQISYSGRLQTDNSGFYLAKYEDEYGTKRLLATTYLMKNNARSVFPCFDEPDKKAQFSINLIHSKNFTAISNEDVLTKRDIGNDQVVTIFKETCNVSTYVVAFTVSQFNYTTKNGLHQVFGRPEVINKNQADYALSKSADLLKAVEEYIQQKYRFPKISHLVIPDEYFATEALESLGHISYNERSFLYSTESSTLINKQNTLTTILHELIHQWFGNLVTPQYWNHLWLSEGFATYLQFRIGDLVEPSWHLLEQFLSIVLETAFEGESSYYATSLNGNNQQEWVPYLKGAAIIRMIENVLTPDIFLCGLRKYITNNQFKSVQPLQLYEALEQCVEGKQSFLEGHTVSEIMKTWDSTNSYPYVNVTRNYLTGHITFEQSSVTPSPNIKSTHLWNIPINYIFNALKANEFSNTTADFWLNNKKVVLNRTSEQNGWLIVNKQFTGYYRVLYDLTNWSRLISLLKSPRFDTIHVLNRAQLLSDSFDFAKRGYLTYEIPFELSLYLYQEQGYAPLAAFFNALNYLNIYLSTSEVYPMFKTYLFNLLEHFIELLGFDENENDSHLEKLNRMNIIKWLCTLGHSKCIQFAKTSLKNWISNKTDVINPNLQEGYLCGALRNASANEWNFVFKMFQSEDSLDVHSRLINALSCTEDESILRRFLSIITANEDGIFKNSEKMKAFIAVIESGNVGLKVATVYVKENFKKVLNTGHMEGILNIIGSRISTNKEYDELKAFKSEYVGIQMIFRQGIYFARMNLDWKKNNLIIVQDWLKNHVEAQKDNFLSINSDRS